MLKAPVYKQYPHGAHNSCSKAPTLFTGRCGEASICLACLQSDAQERFMEAKVAYETLSDGRQRAEYDRRMRMVGQNTESRASRAYNLFADLV